MPSPAELFHPWRVVSARKFKTNEGQGGCMGGIEYGHVLNPGGGRRSSGVGTREGHLGAGRQRVQCAELDERAPIGRVRLV